MYLKIMYILYFLFILIAFFGNISLYLFFSKKSLLVCFQVVIEEYLPLLKVDSKRVAKEEFLNSKACL